jgi:hypothetical protein
VVQINKPAGLKIEGAYLRNRLGDLLPVRPNILDRRSPYISGNARQTLDPGIGAIDRIAHEIIPILARANLEQNAFAVPAFASRDRHAQPQDQSVESRIAYQQVAPATQNEQRQVASLRQAHRLRDSGLVFHLAEKTGRATDPQRRVRRKRDKLLDVQGGTRHGLRLQHRSDSLKRKDHKVNRKTATAPSAPSAKP